MKSYKNFKSHLITVKPNRNNSYFDAYQALCDNGYEYIGEYTQNNQSFHRLYKWQIYKRLSDERLYAFVKMINTNTLIHAINLREFIGDKTQIFI